MKPKIQNIPASIQARLQNKVGEIGQSYNEILQYYGMERFLYLESGGSWNTHCKNHCRAGNHRTNTGLAITAGYKRVFVGENFARISWASIFGGITDLMGTIKNQSH